MAEPSAEDRLYRDVADAQKRVDNATTDVEDLETDASDWPGDAEIASLANDAVSALEELSEKLSDYLRGFDG